MLQEIYYESLNNLSNTGSKMAAETRSQFEKSTGRDQRPKDRIKMMCAVFPVCYFACYQNG